MVTVHGLTLYTTIRNRLHHLKQTLPVNLQQNTDERTRFLVLDYGSTDGLARFLHEQFSSELYSGRLAYYRYEAEGYHQSHSRNLAVRLTGTSIVGNIDADNFAGQDFDRHLISQLTGNPLRVLTALGNASGITDAFGKTALHKELFESINGYDEGFTGYGFEDYDLFYRLGKAGGDMQTIEDSRFLRALVHSDSERTKEESLAKRLDAVYDYPMDSGRRVLLYLFKDGTFHYGILTDYLGGTDESTHTRGMQGLNSFRYSLAGGQWQEGQWKQSGDEIFLQFSVFSASFAPSADGTRLNGHGHAFFRVSDEHQITRLLLFNMQINNRYRLQERLNDTSRQVNPHGYGRGRVSQPLSVSGFNQALTVLPDTMHH